MASTKWTENQFRKRLRLEREAHHWTQAQLAELLDRRGIPMHWTSVAKIENGQRSVRIDEAAAIADLFNTSVDSLLGRNVDQDAEVEYMVRSITSTAERSAGQVRAIVKVIEDARDDLGALDFDGRSVLESSIKRAHRALVAAQGALTSVARFEVGATAAPSTEKIDQARPGRKPKESKR
jgi:transcriptional regulator with XRE-family HTH domain